MQKLPTYLFLLLATYLSFTSVSFAGGTITKCINEPTTLVWTSANASACSGNQVSGSGVCTYIASTGGSQSISAASSCTVNYFCTGPGGSSIVDTATLNVDTTHTWDTINSVCAAPQVVSAVITGQYYPTGTLSLTCSGSDTYRVTVTSGGVTSTVIPTTPYSGPVTFNNISTDGSYIIQCKHGSVSSQVARSYNATPPAAVVNLTVSPTTLAKNDNVTVKWDTAFPTNACTLTARIVCANNSCTVAQTTAQTALNAIITATTTDPDDKHGSRLLTTAIRTVAPGHKDNDAPVILIDWKALGKKTLRILYTTDLTYQCSPTSKETKRVQITKSIDQ